MQVFAVFAVENRNRVQEGLDTHYPDQYWAVGNNAYLLATKDETTKEVATKIGLGDKLEGSTVTSGIVVPVTTYHGRGQMDMWEWLAVKRRSHG